MELDKSFWTERYKSNQLGWDIGSISTPLKTYFDQLDNKSLRILIPGSGNGYEAEYLYSKRFINVFMADISDLPLTNFKNRVNEFPNEQLLHADFFELKGQFDYIIEQTFFSAIWPYRRAEYAQKCYDLLHPGGKIAGVLFNIPLFADHPPFGGPKEDYIPVFESLFNIKI